MEVRPYHPTDLFCFRLQTEQAKVEVGGVTAENAEALATSEKAYTVTVGGEPIACFGVIKVWEGRRHAWAYISDRAAPHFVGMTWKIRRWLRYHGAGRIETAIDAQFVQSVRWAEMMGFIREGTMREYVPGKDFDLYARIG